MDSTRLLLPLLPWEFDIFLVGSPLEILPQEKLLDPGHANASVRRLAHLSQVEAVLVGDGWSVFRNDKERLQESVAVLGRGIGVGGKPISSLRTLIGS